MRPAEISQEADKVGTLTRTGRATPRVTILQRRLIRYRVSLFDQLRKECEALGIELRLVYGQASPEDAKRNDSASLPWADEVRSRWLTVGGTELLWQPCPAEARDCDLIVLTQESKILSNYPLLAQQGWGRRRLVAYWGHGRNLQSDDPDGLRERWKALLVNRVDWWFAYTDHTREILGASGYPASRITCLDNAIDNESLIRDLAEVPEATLDELRREIDLAPGAPLGLHCGALYADKRVDLLVEVAERLHTADPSFRMVVIGDGPARPELERLIGDRRWIRSVGVRDGAAKAAWFRLATAIINPGAVGLHVLDAFAAGVPLFTTGNARHGPEVHYVEDGRNGFVLGDDPQDFADAVLGVVRDPNRYRAVVEAGQAAAGRYTLANMVSNFVGGISDCLEQGRRK
jgi:glycosyltransferase involved in cell wall biosynthesis